MKLVIVSIIIGILMTGLVAFVNFSREGASAFKDGFGVYIAYFVFIFCMVFFGTILAERFGRK